MNAIEIRNLCKSYGGFAIDNLNLTLPSAVLWVSLAKTAQAKAQQSS